MLQSPCSPNTASLEKPLVSRQIFNLKSIHGISTKTSAGFDDGKKNCKPPSSPTLSYLIYGGRFPVGFERLL